jgi:phosphatidylglycerophosphatase A
MYNRSMTNNNTTKENNMTKKYLTAKETEGMTLEQFVKAMQEGKIEVKPEGMGDVTTEMVTMNGKYSCD